MVGPGRGVEELSRAVAERRLRAVFRGAVFRARTPQRRVRPRDQPDDALDHRQIRSRSHLSRLSSRSFEKRLARLSRARLQQGRHRAAHAAPARR